MSNDARLERLRLDPNYRLAVLADNDALRERVEELVQIEAVAFEMWRFLWHERETFDPGEVLLRQGLVAVETAEDYERLEQLEMHLGEVLGLGWDRERPGTLEEGRAMARGGTHIVPGEGGKATVIKDGEIIGRQG